MGLVVSGVWLHILTPAQTAALIVIYGLLVQATASGHSGATSNLRRVMPLVVGGALGVPIGVVAARASRAGLCAPCGRRAAGALQPVRNVAAEARTVASAPRRRYAVGFANGILGGLTGLDRADRGDLVPAHRCAAPRAARDLSAGDSCGLRDDCASGSASAARSRRDVVIAVCTRARADCRRNLARRASLRAAGRGGFPPRDPAAAVSLRPRAAGAGLVRNWHSSARDLQATTLPARHLRGRPRIRYGRRARA